MNNNLIGGLSNLSLCTNAFFAGVFSSSVNSLFRFLNFDNKKGSISYLLLLPLYNFI
ncbi:hypothetical protein IV60_GL001140 [Lancefieldella rimae]|uniref:Uncharacterized protein n=2 Tax=Lancefieldella rimae TaxID=1383 RepID=B9CNI9_LANR4|nr:hypothetical protein ATORI0001_0038 [Lancefieldella rimae ATCC 49626]KRO01894.1 hypothetical protein IV60_GL001140 [Lancefieldella rimae]